MRLNIHEVAQCLDVPLSTVERWIRQGRIPIKKSGGRCIFQKNVLEIWARKHNLPFSLNENQDQKQTEQSTDDLAQAISRGGVFHKIRGNSPKAVLRSLVDFISFMPEEIREDLYRKLVEREGLNSTGIGKGIAIPHPRTPLAVIDEPVIVTCFPEHPVDYSAVDDQPVFALFLLLSPSIRVHLHLLSRLAFCVRDSSFLKFLKTRPDKASLLARVEEFKRALD